MNLADFPLLTKLPNRKKLQLADALWQAAVSDSMPVSAEHKKLLDERWGQYRAGRVKRVPVGQLLSK